MTQRPFIVGFGGTTRAHSSSERLVATVLAEIEALGGQTVLFGGEKLAALPHYAPEHPQRTAGQAEFIEAIRRADGIVIGSPSYHGGISGLVKNAIDLVADLQKDRRVFFDGRPVGLIVAAGGWQGAGATLSAMRDMVHALRGWPTPMGVAVNSGGQLIFDADGNVIDAGTREAISTQAAHIFAFARAAVPAV